VSDPDPATAAPTGDVSLACVVLTMGDRPDELRRAVDSVLAQDGEPIELVVLGNGSDVPALPGAARTSRLDENIGIPAGRNAGVAATTGDVVLFLDDDGWYPDTSLADHLREAFAREPRLGIVSMQVVDPEGGAGQQRHVPRLGRTDAAASSEVTTFLGGASAVRRAVLDEVGGLPGPFFFGHEESDLAWRALDAGWRIRYDAQARMCHPSVPAARHAAYYRLNARNRAWLVRRNLPWTLAVLHLLVWSAITGVRLRFGRSYLVWLAGLREGLRTDAGPRRPIRWRTAWRMTRLGRPPIL